MWDVEVLMVLVLQAEDLHTLMQRMENWAHRLYPKLPFPDFIDKLETLGSKKDVQVSWSIYYRKT